MTSPSAVLDYLKHPVHAFHMTKRMTVGLGTIEANIHEMRQFGGFLFAQNIWDCNTKITKLRRSLLLAPFWGQCCQIATNIISTTILGKSWLLIYLAGTAHSSWNTRFRNLRAKKNSSYSLCVACQEQHISSFKRSMVQVHCKASCELQHLWQTLHAFHKAIVSTTGAIAAQLHLFIFRECQEYLTFMIHR